MMMKNTGRDENYAGGRRSISFSERLVSCYGQLSLYEVTLVIALGGPTFVSRGTSPSCLMGQVGTRNEPHLYNGGGFLCLQIYSHRDNTTSIGLQMPFREAIREMSGFHRDEVRRAFRTTRL